MESEKKILLAALNNQREHVLGILAGLSDENLRRPVLPTGWNCLELIRHLTIDVERLWFRVVASGEAVEPSSSATGGCTTCANCLCT